MHIKKPLFILSLLLLLSCAEDKIKNEKMLWAQHDSLKVSHFEMEFAFNNMETGFHEMTKGIQKAGMDTSTHFIEMNAVFNTLLTHHRKILADDQKIVDEHGVILTSYKEGKLSMKKAGAEHEQLMNERKPVITEHEAMIRSEEEMMGGGNGNPHTGMH